MDVLTATNYLNVERLQEWMSLAVGKELEGRAAEDVSQIFGVGNDIYMPDRGRSSIEIGIYIAGLLKIAMILIGLFISLAKMTVYR